MSDPALLLSADAYHYKRSLRNRGVTEEKEKIFLKFDWYIWNPQPGYGIPKFTRKKWLISSTYRSVPKVMSNKVDKNEYYLS